MSTLRPRLSSVCRLAFTARPFIRATPYSYRNYAASSTGGGPTSTQQSGSSTTSSGEQSKQTTSSSNQASSGTQQSGAQTIGVDTSGSSGKQGRDIVSHRGEGRRMKRRNRDDWTSGDPVERMMNDFFSITPFLGAGVNNPFFDIDKFFTTPSSMSTTTKFDWTPKIDVRETDKAFVVHAELPGMKKEDIKVSLKDGVLTVSGERKMEDKKDEGDYRRIERSYGAFMRSLTLPEGVDPKSIKAKLENGVLEVEVPKPEQKEKEKEETITVA